VKKSAHLVALWQCFGFCHGVLNTDNMSVLGITIDFGPYAFMEHFNPKFICNHSDKDGRYSYENQPKIVKWNLKKLAEALDPEISKEEGTKFVDDNYDYFFSEMYLGKMAEKLGFKGGELTEIEVGVIQELIKVMEMSGNDWTNTFRVLAKFDPSSSEKFVDQLQSYSAPKTVLGAGKRSKYSALELAKIKQILDKNPDILRAFGMEPSAAEEEFKKNDEYKEFMERKEEDMRNEQREAWQSWLKKYSEALNLDKNKDPERSTKMNKANPSFILRNYQMEQAIKKAEKGDFTEVKRLLELAIHPFEEPKDEVYSRIPPDWAQELCVSCSS